MRSAVASVPARFDRKDLRQEFLSLYRYRAKHIYKAPGDKKWKTSKGPLFTGMIDAAISAECSTFYGAFFGEKTSFAVLDIDSRTSQYYNRERLAELLARLQAVGLSVNLYQSSASRGWHLYLPFDDCEQSSEVRQTLKRWLEALGYLITGGQLEVFPSGNALRLPLQSGFAWLDQKSNLLWTREELSTDEALASFLSDLESNARNWADARNRIESQISVIEQAAGDDALAHEDRLDMEGFEQLFTRGKIEAVWEKGRKCWLHGLQAMGERHDAVLAVGHYLWYGDEERSVAALPGDQNAAYRALLIEAWLKEKHNGKCRHINQGNWRVVQNQIRAAAFWRKNKEQWVREHYPLTSRLLKRLVAVYRRTGRIWSIEQFEKANQDRRMGARARIAEAIVSLKGEGLLITIAEVARRAKAHWATVKKNWDLMAVVHTLEEPGLETETNQDLLTRSAGVINPGGGCSPAASESLALLSVPKLLATADQSVPNFELTDSCLQSVIAVPKTSSNFEDGRTVQLVLVQSPGLAKDSEKLEVSDHHGFCELAVDPVAESSNAELLRTFRLLLCEQGNLRGSDGGLAEVFVCAGLSKAARVRGPPTF